jgi:Glycosyltransferase
VPEVIDHGVSGFIVDSVDEAVEMVARLPQVDRARVRSTFETRFTSERMASDYLALYRRLINERKPSIPVETEVLAGVTQIGSSSS